METGIIHNTEHNTWVSPDYDPPVTSCNRCGSYHNYDNCYHKCCANNYDNLKSQDWLSCLVGYGNKTLKGYQHQCSLQVCILSMS